MLCDNREEGIGIVLQFLLAYPADTAELFTVLRHTLHHFAQGSIVKNHIGRQVVFIRQLLAAFTQCLPQGAVFGFVCSDGFSAPARGFLGFCFLAQKQFFLTAQYRPTAVGKAQAAVAFKIDIEQIAADQLAENIAPLGGGEFLADTEDREAIMAELNDALGLLAGEHVDEIVDTKTLAGAIDAGQGFLRRGGGIPGIDGFDAVITVAAGLLQGFIEIGQQRLAAATGDLGKTEHGFEFVVFDAFVLFVGIGLLHHLLEHDHILQAVGHPGIGRQAVTSGATGLLVIGFHAFGQVQMCDKTHVRLVDAHAKGNGRNNNDRVLLEKTLLVLFTQLRTQAGMVRQCGQALVGEPPGRAFHLAARQAVDNAGMVFMFVENKAQQGIARIAARLADAIADIGPVEAGNKQPGLLQLQALADFSAGGFIGGGGQCNARHLGKLLVQQAELDIVGAEVMAPLRHTVRLVDGEQ